MKECTKEREGISASAKTDEFERMKEGKKDPIKEKEKKSKEKKRKRKKEKKKKRKKEKKRS